MGSWVVPAFLQMTGCASGPLPPSSPADPRPIRAEVARELDDFHAAAAAADESRYFAHLTPDAVFLGTDAIERWSVAAFRAYAHPRFAAGKGWTYVATRRAIQLSADGRVAWFDEDLKNSFVGLARGSGL